MSAITTFSPAALAAGVRERAREVGFDLVGVAPAVAPEGFHDLLDWIERGFAGAMEYIPRRAEAYAHPEHVLAGVRSVVMLAINYRTADPRPPASGEGRVSRYAWGGRDYHDVLREKLAHLADWLHEAVPGCRTRGVVDTAPLLERDFARLAGLGWIGKNTVLIDKRAGSWLFLAALLTDIELEADAPHETAHCGTCTRCLDACPTDAFPRPYVLDARKCIAYLNIELRDRPVPVELREGMGDWLFGCDICQDVCPWNRKAPRGIEPAFIPRRDLNPADARELLRLSEHEFRLRFRGTPLDRPQRAGLLRNAAIVLGNTGDRSAIPALTEALADSEPLIRGAAAWALGRLGATEPLAARRNVESDGDVLSEIDDALAR
ncbi:MAG: tRNA epoxyqueuosine(34) reductase QueG [Planctomycetaceae bacterium]